MASSSVRLLRLPVHVHRACRQGAECADGCACMSKPVWKPVRASAWDGLYQPTAAVALVDSSASHCFVLEQLVASFELPVVSGEGMEVKLADGI